MPRGRADGLSRRVQFTALGLNKLDLAVDARTLRPVGKKLHNTQFLLIAFDWAFRSGRIRKAFLASTIRPNSANLGSVLEGGAAGNLGRTSTRLWATRSNIILP